MIIDAHAHAWLAWPYEPPVPDPTTRGAFPQLLWEMDRNNVDRALVVAACIGDNPDNNDYVATAVAAHPDRLLHLADLDSRWSPHHHTPGAAQRLSDAADRWPLAGFTHYLGPRNDGWLVTDEGLALFAEAERRSLLASIAGPPCWQEDLRTVARAFPRMTILLHHLAGLASFAGDLDAGLAAVLPSAALPNVSVKSSGFYYGAPRPWDFPAYPAIRTFERLLGAFGPHRLCWGSDFPVAPLRAHTYRQSIEVLRSHCPFVGPEDLKLILGGSLDAILRRQRQESPCSSP